MYIWYFIQDFVLLMLEEKRMARHQKTEELWKQTFPNGGPYRGYNEARGMLRIHGVI